MQKQSATRAFYKSAAFRPLLVYLAAYAFWLVWPTMHLGWLSFDHHGGGMSTGAFSSPLLTGGYRAALLATPFLVALGALARMIARARVRAGQSDPLSRVRVFAKEHSVLAVILPASMWLAYTVMDVIRRYPASSLRFYYVGFLVAAPVVFFVQVLMTRLMLPALLAPTLEPKGETGNAARADDFELSAVALTREARFAVHGLAGLSVAMVAGLVAMPTFDHLAVDLAVALYVPVAMASALYFRRASRISVGLDGIHVRGASRSRFYAFHELDAVRANGSTIELLRGGRAVLRLQLHGPDAVRRDALAQRLAAAVTRANEERDQPVTRFVNGASGDDLARAAEGGGSYRSAAVSRDQLWAAVEGPAVASGARLAAAKALAISTNASERKRFRIAADHCAEPTVRAQLQELVVEEEEYDRMSLAGRASLRLETERSSVASYPSSAKAAGGQ